MGYPNAQSNPAAAIPVWIAGSTPLNMAVNGYFQAKNASGVFSGLTVNTGGTTSSAAVWDAKSATVTMTIATPGVISWADHGFSAGQRIKFQTTGALPTGLTAGTTYYVLATGLTAGTFRVSSSAGGAAVNTSGSQSGVHTGYALYNLIGTYSTLAQGNIPSGVNGASFAQGLLVIAAGGAAADITALYR